MKDQIIITSDGSKTLKLDGVDEHYHSTHGALAEAMHVYIDAGFKQVKKNKVSILEMGFGTGLNTFSTYLENKGNKEVLYTAIESSPISLELATQLDYVRSLNAHDHENVFVRLHACDWGKKQNIGANFHLIKNKGLIQDIVLEGTFDLVYYDAFGPRTQPELWEIGIFQKIYDSMNIDAILVTYCAKGSVKRNLKAVGFEISSLPGPPGKREITRATKRFKE
jgi:tRNA U34 5-methylaminomethyl-2-thiouridine-forming methyltransferase MnmC